jgi:hypothetical protein
MDSILTPRPVRIPSNLTRYTDRIEWVARRQAEIAEGEANAAKPTRAEVQPKIDALAAEAETACLTRCMEIEKQVNALIAGCRRQS